MTQRVRENFLEITTEECLEAIKNGFHPCKGCARTGSTRNCTPVRCGLLDRYQNLVYGKGNGFSMTSAHRVTLDEISLFAHRPGNRGAYSS